MARKPSAWYEGIKVDKRFKGEFNERVKGSLNEQASHDPALQERIREGRKRFLADQNAMERWARANAQSNTAPAEL